MQLTFPHRRTWLHRVNPVVKLVLFSLWFFAIILIHDFSVMINVAIGSVLLLIWSGHPWKRLLLYASPFLLVFVSSTTGMMFFGSGETPWFKWGIVNITEESFYRGLHLGFRALSMAAVGLLFGLTTRPVDLFYALMQKAKLPPKYAYSFLAAMRMIPILVEEFQTLRHALKIRGMKKQGKLMTIYRTWHRYAIPLLAQSIRRAHRIAVAMEAKRFAGGAKRTYYYIIGFTYRDIAFAALTAVLFAASFAAGIQWPYIADITDVR
ncbi:energy-coupling factor transporter transmembrane component T family protein [Cohnella terricola]|uniref:Energy-coupling factor transporter transmembrane protein EcfT n=1 Tax=Cohnella terricola TaxID=1289167 RepID=A0A559JNA3_9BACL|nr:energy-coupling factor transporter transmembrane component T [Cohnella terricola]TVY01359.1 energy-coupling factor transporter transmembrane protein EcfT [Cohnella terricola]